MADYTLTCCSAADLPADYYESHDLKCAPFHIRFDGVQHDDLGDDLVACDLFRRMSDGGEFKAMPPQIGDYIDAWEPSLKEGKEIVHLSVASNFCGAFSAARSASEILELDYAGKIHIIDTCCVSAGYALILDKVCALRDEGKSLEEIEEWVAANKGKVQHWFFTTDLNTYYNTGILKKGAVLFGTAFGSLPVFGLDENGAVTPRTKAHGPKNCIASLAKHMQDLAADGRAYDGPCFITHSACEGYARELSDQVASAFPNLAFKILINEIGLGTGSLVGAGTVMLAFLGK